MIPNPDFRFGDQQVDKLRAGYDARRSSAGEATLVKAPSYFPSWDHVALMRMLFDKKGEVRPLAMAKANHADARKQLPVKKVAEPAAVVTLKDPADGPWRGFIPLPQLFGSAAAVLHYNCFPRAIASLSCGVLKAPCIGYYDVFGIVAPSCFVGVALEAFTEPNKALPVALQTHKSEAGSSSEFLGLAASFRDDGGNVIASRASSGTEIKKRVGFAEDLAKQDFAALATPQKLAGKLSFTQTAILGRFGRSVLQPIYELIARGRGAVSRHVEGCPKRSLSGLPAIPPRLISSLRREEPADPVRIYPDAAGAGELDGASFFSDEGGRQPILLIAQADEKLHMLAATPNKIYIFKHFAASATVSLPRGRLWGRIVILFLDNEAACAALTKWASRSKASLLLVYSHWAIAAPYDIAIWTGRVPTQVNPADVPPRSGQLSFNTELSEDLDPPLRAFPHQRFLVGAFAARNLNAKQLRPRASRNLNNGGFRRQKLEARATSMPPASQSADALQPGRSSQ